MTTIRIVLILKLLANCITRIYNVKGAFFKGQIEDSKEIFMEVPQGVEHHYWGLAIVRLLKSIYGLKQAKLLFWQRLLEIMKNKGHK